MRTSDQFNGRTLSVALAILTSPCLADAQHTRLVFGDDQGVFGPSQAKVFDGITQAEVSSVVPYASPFLVPLQVKISMPAHYCCRAR